MICGPARRLMCTSGSAKVSYALVKSFHGHGDAAATRPGATRCSKAGYTDARPLTANSTTFSCYARPDHAFGSKCDMAASPRHFRSSPQSRPSLTRLARQLRANNDIAPYLRMQSHDNLMRIDAPGRGIHLLSTPLAEVRT